MYSGSTLWLDDIAFDGEHVRVVWSRLPGAEVVGLPSHLYMARLGKDGAVLAPGTISVSPQALHGVLAGALLTWQNERPDGFRFGLYGARIGAKGTLLDVPPLNLARGTNAQSQPAVAFDGERYIAAWIDMRDRATGAEDALFAARVATDGRVLDEGGVRIAEALKKPALISGGSSMLALWTSDVNEDDLYSVGVYGAHITSSLDMVDPEPLPITGAADRRGYATSIDDKGFAILVGDDLTRMSPEGDRSQSQLVGGPEEDDPVALAFDGARRVVVWVPTYQDFVIRAARLGPADEILDPGGVALSEPVGDLPFHRLVVAHADGIYLAAWQRCAPSGDVMQVEGIRFSASGEIRILDASPLRLAENAQACDFKWPELGLDAVFDGERFVVAWSELGQPDDQESADLRAIAISPGSWARSAAAMPPVGRPPAHPIPTRPTCRWTPMGSRWAAGPRRSCPWPRMRRSGSPPPARGDTISGSVSVAVPAGPRLSPAMVSTTRTPASS